MWEDTDEDENCLILKSVQMWRPHPSFMSVLTHSIFTTATIEHSHSIKEQTSINQTAVIYGKLNRVQNKYKNGYNNITV